MSTHPSIGDSTDTRSSGYTEVYSHSDDTPTQPDRKVFKKRLTPFGIEDIYEDFIDDVGKVPNRQQGLTKSHKV